MRFGAFLFFLNNNPVRFGAALFCTMRCGAFFFVNNPKVRVDAFLLKDEIVRCGVARFFVL